MKRTIEVHAGALMASPAHSDKPDDFVTCDLMLYNGAPITNNFRQVWIATPSGCPLWVFLSRTKGLPDA